MKLTAENLSLALATYIDQEIGAHFSVATRFAVSLLARPFINRIPQLLNQYATILTMVGYMDDEGKIDLDVLIDNLRLAFKDSPKVPLYGVVFSESDVDAFKAIAEKLAE